MRKTANEVQAEREAGLRKLLKWHVGSERRDVLKLLYPHLGRPVGWASGKRPKWRGKERGFEARGLSPEEMERWLDVLQRGQGAP